MLVNYDAKLITLFHPRTASRSQEAALLTRGFVNPDKQEQRCKKLPIMWDVGVGDHHLTLSEQPPGWTVFTTVRNHFDIIVSEFTSTGDRAKFGLTPQYIDWLHSGLEVSGLRDYYWPVPNEYFGYHRRWATDTLRFENLDKDLNNLLERHGLERVDLHHIGKTRRYGKPYQPFYDDETRAYIEGRYAKEMSELGYSWNDGTEVYR